MSLAAFTWTARARPFVELGIGDLRVAETARWDTAHWDAPDALWAGTEPVWFDITCDTFLARFEYGRKATSDRFVAGAATVVVDNATGWADPNHVDPPNALTVRPGRQIRVGVDHVAYGRRVLFRGFIDGMTPTYSPIGTDTVELACIDALGEVNRAKMRPLEAPVGAGEHASDRATRILDAIAWPATSRDVWPSSEPLLETDLGGQVADLLGRTADSAGGAVFGDTAGRVAFRPRDWQTYIPGTPVDATIGNVEHGHTVPAVPAIPGYLDAALGRVTTPDTADMSVIDGTIRVTVNARLDNMQTGSRFLILKGGTTATNREYAAYLATPSIYMSTTRQDGTATVTDFIQQNAPLGTIRTYGFEMTPRSAAAVAIVDTVRTVRTFTAPAGLPDRSEQLQVGPLAGALFDGRIYWAQMEAINRARLVFPGVAGNGLSVPNAANLQITGDLELVHRWSCADLTRQSATLTGKGNPYVLYLDGFKRLRLDVRVAGATTTGYSGFGTFNNNTLYWTKVTRVAATGACAFYWAPDSPSEPTSWTALGTATTTAGSINTDNAAVEIGAAFTATLFTFPGRIARVIVRNGIAGTTVLDVSENNAGGIPPGATTFVASTGQTVTIANTPSPGYLTPTVGTVTTPDPGPLPAQHTFVIKMRPTRSADSPNVIAGQFETEGQMSWTETWYEGPNYHAFYYGLTATGSSGGTQQRAISNPTDLVNTDAFMAISVTLNSAGRNRQTLLRSLDNGATWQTVVADADTGVAVAPFDSNTVMRIGARTGAVSPFNGRIYSVELRTGLDPKAGTVVWRFDANDYPGTGTSYVDPRGRTWTLSAAGAIVPQVAPIVQPQADAVVWRFDANEYPGTGTSYVDPRGRTWTLSGDGAIVPKVPAVPELTVAADVCPVLWERPFNRADITTRAIIGRDLETAAVADDPVGMAQYGIEPFERTDLLTVHDSSLVMLANRVLRTRAASTAPRVRAVTLDARTADNALDLMSTVDVYHPSRYRCRLLEDRGLIFDDEYFATGVAHEMTPSAWVLALNLDLAAPFAAQGGRWDGAYWDLATWTVAS